MYVSNDPCVCTNVCCNKCLVENVYFYNSRHFSSLFLSRILELFTIITQFPTIVVCTITFFASNASLVYNDSSVWTTVSYSECPVKHVYLYN